MVSNLHLPGLGRKKPEPKPRTTLQERLRYFVPGLGVAHLAVVLLVVLLAIVLLVSNKATFTALPATIGQILLVVYGAPVASFDTVVSATPILPALIVFLVIVRRIRFLVRAKVSFNDVLVLWAVGLLIPALIVALAVFMVADASAVYSVRLGSPALIVVKPLVWQVLALVFGMGPKLWRGIFRKFHLPDSLRKGVTVATTFLIILAGFALVVDVIMMLVNGKDLAHISSPAPAVINVLLALGYLPNFVIATMAVLAGGVAEFAGAEVSLYAAAPHWQAPIFYSVVIPTQMPELAIGLLAAPIVAAILAIMWRRQLLGWPLVITTAIAGSLLSAAINLLVQGKVGNLGSWQPNLPLAVLLQTGFVVAAVILHQLFVLIFRSSVPAKAVAEEVAPVASAPAAGDTDTSEVETSEAEPAEAASTQAEAAAAEDAESELLGQEPAADDAAAVAEAGEQVAAAEQAAVAEETVVDGQVTAGEQAEVDGEAAADEEPGEPAAGDPEDENDDSLDQPLGK